MSRQFRGAIAIAVLCAGHVVAQDAATPVATAPSADQTAAPAAALSVGPPISPGPHIVKPPAPGTRHFITVQIDPSEQAKALASLPPYVPLTKPVQVAASGPGRAPTGMAHYDWYWEAVSPSLTDRSGRFAKALAALTLGPDGQAVASPRFADMQKMAVTYGPQILSATVGTQVSPALVLAVMGVESAGNATATSPAGAKGLMQLIPATATRFGVSDTFDTIQNIKGGVAYLNWLMKKFDGDPVMVLAAYNAGENAVTANNGVPPYAETRDYVPKVLAAWTVAQGLCLTPPELVSDGCVFRTAGN